jgi:cell division protease FtsH
MMSISSLIKDDRFMPGPSGRPKGWVPLAVSIAFVALVIYFLVRKDPEEVRTLDYTQLMASVEAREIKSVFLQDAKVTGEMTDGTRFMTDVPNAQTQARLADRLAGSHIAVRFAAPGGIDTMQIVSSVFMALSLCVLFFFVVKRSPNYFGKEQKHSVNLDRTAVRFTDVDGVDEAKQELQEIVEFLSKPDRFTRLGGRIPRGVLLVGPPGTGKTLLARAVAGEAGVPFFSMSGSEFVEMFVGVGARRVRNLFAQARKAAPCIVFIDEIDAIGRHRGGPSSGHNEEREQALNQLLVEMDGFDPTIGIVVMAATNRQDVLDQALLRPGRFDRRVTVDRPDIRGRRLILEVHTRNTPLAKGVDLHKVARGTPGFSGADLANLVNEAALSAARARRDELLMDDFEMARDKVLMGAERSSAVLTDADRIRIAVHEGGHALAALSLPCSDPVHKVSIIPRGMALGVTMQLPEGDRLMYSREYLEAQIAVLMAGRVAEEMVLGSFASGSANDIERATSIARKMVRQLGMSRLGPVVCLERASGSGHGDFLSEYSTRTEERIDEEVESILKGQMELARNILVSQRQALLDLRDVLLEEETIDRDRFLAVVAAAAEKEKKNEMELSEVTV